MINNKNKSVSIKEKYYLPISKKYYKKLKKIDICGAKVSLKQKIEIALDLLFRDYKNGGPLELHTATRKLIKIGVLKSKNRCEKCKTKRKLHIHHLSNRTDDILFLCVRCHRKIHSGIN